MNNFILQLVAGLREAWTQALELDKAYTDLIKVQDELTRGDYHSYLEQCNKKAQKLATTQKSLIEGAAEFSRSGYTRAESDQLAEKSTILSNVGDMSATDSAKAIISGVQAYDVVDGYDNVIDKQMVKHFVLYMIYLSIFQRYINRCQIQTKVHS